jgi:hypothetical protein
LEKPEKISILAKQTSNFTDTKRFLKVVNGKVELWSMCGVKIKTYYSKGNAIRADFFDEKVESVLIHLATGKLLIISKSGVNKNYLILWPQKS